MNEQHEQFENDVCRWLRAAGWVVPPSVTYHDVFTPHIARGFGARFDATSLSIRGQADRVAFLAKSEQSVRVEIKTVGPRHKNLAVELVPFVEHLQRAAMGCECVYAVRHVGDGKEYGIRVRGAVVARAAAVMVPARWSDREMSQLIEHTGPVLEPHAPDGVKFVRVPDPLRGSGDPYLLFPADCLDDFDGWRTAFMDISQTAKGLTNATNSHDKTGLLDQ